MSRLIDADALKAEHGMKDDCADCDREFRGKSRSCEFDRIYTLMDFCGWIDDAPTIEPHRENGYRDGYKRGKRAGYKKARNAGRKKGKWTKENACEFCGFQPWFERDIHTLSFCPNCGADLREEGETE